VRHTPESFRAESKISNKPIRSLGRVRPVPAENYTRLPAPADCRGDLRNYQSPIVLRATIGTEPSFRITRCLVEIINYVEWTPSEITNGNTYNPAKSKRTSFRIRDTGHSSFFYTDTVFRRRIR